MKNILTGAMALSLLVTAVSCKKEVKTESSVSTDTLATVLPKDSVVVAQTDSATVTTPTPSSTPVLAENIITKSVGKYPHDIKLFEDKNITARLKKLVGNQYDEMVKNFNVESPVSSENGIYKLSGCKQHDCPGYSTSIYFDAHNDNLNVSIDKNEQVTHFAEKGKIKVSDALKVK
ncbi:hypothetical protein [Chryseobacterium pennipullorum]|uniref:Uncharacterized protein n=1 Tax=Chryseobacterium pennipullorum TaxID=2258963 RepID=A0A3D9B0L4_9FLAO|nr:hypothetical protein [Chryseobacterium pennipullorum]REC46786.1 hypothetical protein DRF67_13285 [Chryseobacterium pennipullorum]